MASGAAAGVQIMSIHRSTGLEFPIVILADLNKPFNRTDLQTPVLVHPSWDWGHCTSTWTGTSATPPPPGRRCPPA